MRIAFGIAAAVMLMSALRVVTVRDLVHTVLWLGLTLSSTAVLYVLLSAPFFAAIQLLLYTGGIMTLMLFGVMLTRRETANHGDAIPNESSHPMRGFVVAAALFGVLAAAVVKTPGLPNAADAGDASAKALGGSFLTDYLLAFEVLGVFLLVAVIGAIVLARRGDPIGQARRSQIPSRQHPEAGGPKA